EGNYIGTDACGRSLSGVSTEAGIDDVGGHDNIIGGPAPGAGNLISGINGFSNADALAINATNELVQGNTITGNLGGGVVVHFSQGWNADSSGIAGFGSQSFDVPDTGNRIEGNSIYGNGGVGIDLASDFDGLRGLTANSSESGPGPNNWQYFPALIAAF